MPRIRVRDKHQIALPKEVVAFLQLKPDTYLEYSMTANGVLLKPTQFKKVRVDIFSYAGAGKKQVYKTVQEADAYISKLRDDWEH